MSLRKLAARLEETPGGEELISHASLQRIESGKQPYSEPILNALAAAFDIEPWMLLEMHPERGGAVVDLLIHLDAATQKQALKLIEAIRPDVVPSEPAPLQRRPKLKKL
ncbi:MAG: hypothetical protein WDN46_14115 [Methylocella sp.]